MVEHDKEPIYLIGVIMNLTFAFRELRQLNWQIEKQIMEAMPQKDWGEVGMAISFLGRETCRPTNPKHSECVMKSVCAYYKSQKVKGEK